MSIVLSTEYSSIIRKAAPLSPCGPAPNTYEKKLGLKSRILDPERRSCSTLFTLSDMYIPCSSLENSNLRYVGEFTSTREKRLCVLPSASIHSNIIDSFSNNMDRLFFPPSP